MPQAIAYAAQTAWAWLGSGSITAGLAKAALSIGASTLISRALAPKPGSGLTSGSPIKMSQEPAPVGRGIYGTVRVSGPIAFAYARNTVHADNGEIFLSIPVAIHEIDGFEDTVWLHDVPVTMSGSEATGDYATWLSRYGTQLGSDTQSANAVFVSEFPSLWGVNHRGRGIASADVRLSYPADPSELFPGGLPNLSFLVRGRKVFDPRDEGQDQADPSTWVYSANPALCLLDYLCNDYFGLGVSYADQIEPYVDLWIAAANVCDEDVSGSPRYECHGTWDTDVEPGEVIQNIVNTMAGELYYVDGSYLLFAGAARTAESDVLTTDDLRGAVEIQCADETRETCNIVRGTFTFPGDGYVPRDYPEAASSVYVSEDNGVELPRQKPYAWVTSSAQAQRLAWIELKQARQDMTVRAECKLSVERYRVGDIVPFTLPEMGWTEKLWRIVRHESVELPPEGESGASGRGVDLTLREYAAAVYDDETPSDVDPAPNTTLPPAFP